jgi:hypothetical protein
MIATLGRWQIGEISKHPEKKAVWICWYRTRGREQPGDGQEDETAVGDFIARQVLEKESLFFEG